MFKDRLITFAISYAIIYSIFTIAFGSHGAIGFIIYSAIAIWASVRFEKRNLLIWSRIVGTKGNSGPAVLPGKLIVFGEQITPPNFLARVYDERRNLFGKKIFYRAEKDNHVVRGDLTDIGDGELVQCRLMEAMWESARLERVLRGHPIKDRVNTLLYPILCEDGFIIEEIDNEDGSRSRILADGIRSTLDENEWLQATTNGFGRSKGAWSKKPYAKVRVKKTEGYGFWRFDLHSMPLFHLNLREVVLQGDYETQQDDGSVKLDMPEDWQ